MEILLEFRLIRREHFEQPQNENVAHSLADVAIFEISPTVTPAIYIGLHIAKFLKVFEPIPRHGTNF